MKLTTILITLIALLTLSITAYADEKITTAKLKELATTDREPRQHTTYLSKDGKVRYSVYDVHLDDGTVEMRTKKSYLPAVTDGVNHDKTSKFRIPPSAKKMAKWFAKGANHAMFLSMIIDVLGDGVDYVLDPRNNSVQYKEKGNYKVGEYYGATAQEACQKYFNYVASLYEDGYADRVVATGNNCLVYGGKRKFNGNVLASITEIVKSETKVMNDEEFAQAVIELAKADNAKAKKVVLDVAKQAVSDGDYDKEIQKAVDELNADETKDDTQDNQDNTSDSSNASSSDSTNTDSQDDTQATPKNQNETDNDGGKEKDKFELPGFCDWATKVCEFIDWMKEPPPSDELPKQVPKATISDVGDLGSVDRYRQRINFDGQCPTGTLSFEVKSVAYSYQIPYHHFCSLLEQLRPWLLAFTYLSTAFFVVRSL